MVHIQILVGPQSKVFGTGLQVDLTRGFIVSCGAGYNTHHISWDSSGILIPPPQCWFLRVGMSEAKNQHWEGRSTTFCQNMGSAWGVPT